MSVIGSARVIKAAVAGLSVITAVMFAGVAHASSGAAVASEAPPTEKITMDLRSVNGSGCIPGSATATMASDNTGFHISYNNFIAYAAGGAASIPARKNCQVNVVVHIPQGFTLAIARADYRGRFNLPSDATALESTNYYIQGSVNNDFVDHAFNGPASGSWHAIDATPVTALVWAACGRDVSLNINTTLIATAGSTPSWISLRSSDGDVDTLVQFNWKTCS